ncbi:MAG: efflux RND transporter permease subunit [Candidatus Omnitrophica bacterium]|jgi:HAE1 family hydrophobic/amphiphilic exporter-1|nr:efflux RND transporter permease subunit [Candidatus Omnitrophota bacterium]
MNLSEFGVRKPITNLMIFSAIFVLALYSFSRLGVDLLPEIEPPIISVISNYSGANPEDVETKVTEVLENQLGTTPGLEKITSTSSEGMSVIQLKFIWGTNLDEASNDIRDRIELAKQSLPDIPDEMDNPYIFKFNTANMPILVLGVTAEGSYPDLYDIIDRRVSDNLKQIPGVGTVLIQGGGMVRQINVWVDRPRLEGYGLSVLDVESAIRQENVTQPVGSLKSGLTDYLIRLPGEFAGPQDINSIIIGRKDNRYVYLKDVARVEDGFKEVKTRVRINRKPGLVLMVQKQNGTNTVAVAERVKRRLSQLESDLPPDVRLQVIFDTSKDIISSVDSLKSSVWLAVVMVIVVVWFFLRRFLPSLIIALTIPFSLLISFIYLFLSGKTINTISLSSVAIASGMVVDNAIVVVDSVMRRLEGGQRPREAAIFGTSEMFLSIAASTMTTVVVFAPMLFIPGIVGIMFGELAVIIIVTLLGSLFTSATFSPMLCSQWLKTGKPANSSNLLGRLYAASENWLGALERLYSGILRWCLGHKKLVLFGSLGIFVFSLFLLRFVGNEFAPEEDSGDLRMSVYLPIGTRFEESDKIAARIEDILDREVPERLFYYVRSGEVSGVGKSMGNASGSHIITCGAKLVPKTARERSVKEIGQILRGRIRALPGVVRTDITTGNPMGRVISGSGGKSVQVEIIGHSFQDTDAVAAQIKDIMENIPGAVDVSISREANRPELRIDVDREKSSSLGLNMQMITDTVKAFIEGNTAGHYREKGKTYDISVRAEEKFRLKPEDIESITVYPASGGGVDPGRQVRLSNIAGISEVLVPQEIERKNRERVVRVECNAYKRSSGKIVEDVKRELNKLTLPSDITLELGGEAEEQTKAFRDLALLLALGIILVYMVMAAQFESLIDPFIVMFSIPFTFVGVIFAFIISGMTLNIISFLGVVMLMGIVVNNAIVLISYINILRARGLALSEAVIRGGGDRLRPVLMTTITTLVGLMPLALSNGEGSESWQPLGVTMIGGLSVSTLITLLFIPTLYAVFETRLKKKAA